MARRFSSALWLLWLAAAVWITAGPLRWHIEYFQSPGPAFYRAALIAIPGFAIAAAVWTRARRAGLWRYELPVLAGLVLAAAAIREPRAVMVAAGVFAAAYAMGHALLKWFGIPRESPAEDLALSGAAGFAVLQAILLATGMAGLWRPWFFVLMIAVPCALWFRSPAELYRAARGIVWGWMREEALSGALAGIAAPFAAVYAACTACEMLTPTVVFDALRTHLPLARYYVSRHALSPKPDLDYSFFPQGAESVFAAAWALGGQAAAQLISPVFFALALLLLWRVARLCGAPPAGAFCGVLLAVSMPFLHWSGSAPKNDMQVTAFLLGAVVCCLRWRESGSFGWIQLGAVLVSGGFAVKHTAAFAALPLVAYFATVIWRQPRRIRAAASLLLIFLVCAAGWHVRTWVLAGNPVYPLNTATNPNPNHPPDANLAATAVRLARLPWTVHFGGFPFFESPSPTPLGIALLMFWPVWFLSGRPNRGEIACLWFCAAGFYGWGLTDTTVRYAAAPVAVMAALTGGRLARFYDASAAPARFTLLAACAWVLSLGFCAAMVVGVNAPQLLYLAGRLDRPGYLRQASIAYPPLEYLNAHSRANERILGLGDCADLYAPEFPRYRSICGPGRWDEARIAGQLGGRRFDWLLAPRASQSAAAAAVAAQKRQDPPGKTPQQAVSAAAPVYSDPYFVIFRLSERNP